MLESLEGTQKEADADVKEVWARGEEEAFEEMKVRKDVADKHIELFGREHDSTGAWKSDRFGRDIATELKARTWERDKGGKLAVTAEDERSHILLVNMGDLDRLNASGDHALGDKGLRLTAERVESALREVLQRRPEYKDERRLSDAYDIYRYSGNDFTVNLRDVDEDDAEEIRRRLSQDPVPVAEGEEPVPLVASRVSRAEGIAMLNGLDQKPEDFGLSTEKMLITALMEKAQTLNDVGKTEERANRMADKILLANAGKLTQEGVRKHYDQFLKKSLGGAFKPIDAKDPLDFEGFKAFVEAQRGPLEGFPPPGWTHAVAERSLDSAFDSLKSRRSVGRAIELNMARNVAKDVLKRTETFGTVIVGEAVPESTPDFAIPKATRGKKEIERLKGIATDAETHRNESTMAAATADLRHVELEIEAAKRDSQRTGLYQRGVFFENMEAGFREGKPVSVISIDMAFLKYFDKEGGPACGNLAIEKSAEILDGIAKELSVEEDTEHNVKGVKVEAYRLGGDEFAISVVGGGPKDIENIQDFLRDRAKSAGPVPAQAGAQPNYHSENLIFNYGIRSADDPESFKKKLAAMDIPLEKEGTPMEQNELAEYAMRLADKEVEIQKAYNRMSMLLNRTRDAKTFGSRGNLDTLLQYSQKAIFGEDGSNLIAAFAERLDRSPETIAKAKAENRELKDPIAEFGAIRGEMLTFIIDQIDAKNRKKQQFETSLDSRLEDAVRTEFFKQRILELEDKVRGLEAQIHEDDKEKDILKHQVTAAKSERDAVINLRERLAGAPPPTKPPEELSKAA
jgi:GGDEF domain-containing protein